MPSLNRQPPTDNRRVRCGAWRMPFPNPPTVDFTGAFKALGREARMNVHAEPSSNGQSRQNQHVQARGHPATGATDSSCFGGGKRDSARSTVYDRAEQRAAGAASPRLVRRGVSRQ